MFLQFSTSKSGFRHWVSGFGLWASLGLGALSLNACKAVGKHPSEKKLSSEQIPHYRDGRFYNLDTLPADYKKTTMTKVMREMRNRPATVRPANALPAVKTDLIHTTFVKPTIIWFGHSSFLIKSSTSTILADPNLSDHAGTGIFRIRAFPDSISYEVEDLPVIDVLIISHDHYDHLDYKTILKLKDKVKKVIVPLGVGADFISWGYDPEIILELDWNQSVKISDQLSIIVTPARHRSGRTFTENKSLWASYVIRLDGYSFYYSGDTGYGRHFKMIGDRYGPFDLALMECGQYNANWPYTHMFPEQTALAAADLKARMIIPIHWGKFAESTHPWNESVREMIPFADSLHIPVCIPKIGEPYSIGSPALLNGWWNR